MTDTDITDAVHATQSLIIDGSTMTQDLGNGQGLIDVTAAVDPMAPPDENSGDYQE